MKKLKYIPLIAMLFGLLTFACNDEGVNPLRTGGDDEDEDPIIIPPPSTNNSDSVIVSPY